MIEALVEALQFSDAEMAVRVVVLTGEGSAFSSGCNLNKMGEAGAVNDRLPAQTRRNYKWGVQRLPLLFESLEVPVIVAVHGPTIGAGCDLARMCDARIAAQRARFARSRPCWASGTPSSTDAKKVRSPFALHQFKVHAMKYRFISC
jgi:enoyl-CoA hydratase/carnithine racemase